ncbi:MAG: hypothetical protein EOP49_19840, partial [Sphingobacteriales bacterium]
MHYNTKSLIIALGLSLSTTIQAWTEVITDPVLTWKVKLDWANCTTTNYTPSISLPWGDFGWGPKKLSVEEAADWGLANFPLKSGWSNKWVASNQTGQGTYYRYKDTCEALSKGPWSEYANGTNYAGHQELITACVRETYTDTGPNYTYVYKESNPVQNKSGFFLRKEWNCDEAAGFRLTEREIDGISRKICVKTIYTPNRDQCNKSSPPTVGNPIDPATGAKTQQEIDYHGPGALAIRRTYTSEGAISRKFARNDEVRLVSSATSLATNSCWPMHIDDGWTGLLLCQPIINIRSDNTDSSWFYFDQNGRHIPLNETINSMGLSGHTENSKTFLKDTSANVLRTFDSEGLLLEEVSADGAKKLYYSYGKNISNQYPIVPGLDCPTKGGGQFFKPTCNFDTFGRSLVYSYGENGDVSSITLPDGESITYEYDSNGRLGSIIFPDMAGRQYHYAEPDLIGAQYTDLSRLLTGISDISPLGFYKRFAYFEYGTYLSNPVAVKTYYKAGEVEVNSHTVSYPSLNASSTVVDPSGASQNLTFTGSLPIQLKSQSQAAGSGCAGSSAELTYHATTKRLTSRIDFNRRKTCYTMNSMNFETARVEGIAESTDCSVVLSSSNLLDYSAEARKISTQWHPDWKLETRRAEPKKLTTWVYNGQPDPFNGNQIANCTS